ncbi:MAG: triose-phosphate isomerase [Gammaproteobacteria bacterium]|nr:triose-phosphate isomerase [Gammaproteobacteria bacterium]
MRTPIIAGNWKMHNTIAAALELVKGIHYGLPWPGEVEVIVAPPTTAISKVADFLQDSYIQVAGQDLFWEESGAYTGEISGTLLQDAGASAVIIGHSERRQYFHETDATVNKKIKAALALQLMPIVCVGETLAEREAGQVTEVVRTQILEGLAGLTTAEVTDLVIAYEPIWAIGTGKTATPQQAEDVHVIIRHIIAEQFGNDAADAVRILYGGSVKPANSKELLSLPNVDGALVGGASLKAADFIEIIKSVS